MTVEQMLTLADFTKESVTKLILRMMKWYSDVQIIYQTLLAIVQSTYNSKSIPWMMYKNSPYYGETISIFTEKEQHGYII